MAAMVIEVPEELKDFGVAVLATIEVVQKAVAGSVGGKAVDYDAVECAIADATARSECAAHGAVLQSLDVDKPTIAIGGKLHRRVGRCEATYYTMAGPALVTRSLYRERGVRNGKVTDPVSVRAGVIADGWLPRTARAMAHALQQSTSRDAEASSRESKRLPYSRSSFEDVAHAVGEVYLPHHVDIEGMLIDELVVPKEACSVSASLDRVNVPMEEPRARPVGRPKKNAPKRPIVRNFRQAYCGTVTLHDANGEALHTIRYGRMPQGNVAELVEGMAADVGMLIAQRGDLLVDLLCDGAPEMWNLLRVQFNAENFGKVHELIDLRHTMEKLGAAAEVIHGENRRAVTQRWKLRLLNSSRAVKDILAELHGSGREHVKVGKTMPVHEAITYLTNQGDRMDYASARRMGLPLGSGNVEATCKSLFEVRFKRAGSRWKEVTGEHIVHLRALAISDRWPRAMEFTMQRLRRAVKAVV
jgi:hypothetical protein